MTKIPLEILHFCETTNFGHDGNMPFLVLQVDDLLEGFSVIYTRLYKLLRIVHLALRTGSVPLCVIRSHSSALYFASLPSVHLRLCHPKLPGSCTIRSSFRSSIIFGCASLYFPDWFSCDEVQKTKYLFFEGDLRPQQ